MQELANENRKRTMNNEQILEKLRAILAEAFEIDPARVTPETHLFEELDLDSIDAVDLAIKLQEMTGKRIRPEDFKSVRTVGDVIGTVQVLLAT
jgi:acyl carrier protein